MEKKAEGRFTIQLEAAIHRVEDAENHLDGAYIFKKPVLKDLRSYGVEEIHPKPAHYL